MNQIGEKLAEMSEQEKDEWIYNMARTTGEKRRNDFINSLIAIDTQQDHRLISLKKEMDDWCEKVDDQEIYIECRGYEVYGDSYWDNDWSYEYSDPFGIGSQLIRAFQVAEDLLFHKQYEQALDLYERLCMMSFSTLDNDMGEWSELELEDLVENELVSLNLKSILLNLMYARYQESRGVKRAEMLYRYLSWRMHPNINIEDMFIVGPEELTGLDIFMEEWISFLKNMNGDLAGELLTEACLYQGGCERLGEIAKEVRERHPVLYKNACQQLLDDNNLSECEELGLEAIGLLPENLIIRGTIANLTAEAAERLEHADVVKQCYEAAFYADATLNHYLRLFKLPEHQDMTERAAKYALTLPYDRTWRENHNNNQLLENQLPDDYKKAIRFFNGEFDDIMAISRREKAVLGWSSDFKGIAVPLFILLLDKNNDVTKAGQRLMSGLARRLGYHEDEQSFADRFIYWKEKIVLTNEQYEKYLAWLHKEVEQRTEAVVGGGYRNSYYKAAELIVALGETLESNGALHGKENLIEHYRKKHSRKSAFKAELYSL